MMMKNKLLIVGAGGLGRMTMESAIAQYECYFLDDNYQKGTIICDCEVVGSISDLELLYPKYKNLIVAIGNNILREKLYKHAIHIGYCVPTIINDTAYVSNYCEIGSGTIILSNASIQNGAIIKNGVVITANVEIHHDCEVDDFALIYSNTTIRTNARVGKRVKIGSNVSISNDVIINDDEIINNGDVL